MSVEDLKQLISDAVSQADRHAHECSVAISDTGLQEAIDYCTSQNITPPQCSLTARSPNADILRAQARRKLSDPEWWKKQLKKLAIEQFEHDQRLADNVRDGISDTLIEYHKQKK